MTTYRTTDHAAPRQPKPTPRYDQVLAHAQHVAFAEGGDVVGVEHLMLAILDDGESVSNCCARALGRARGHPR